MTHATAILKHNPLRRSHGKTALGEASRAGVTVFPLERATRTGFGAATLASGGVLLTTLWTSIADATAPGPGACSPSGWLRLGAQALLFGLLLGIWSRLAAARPAPARPTVLGSYTLGEKLGEGGMGLVYAAHHALLPRPSAVKLLKPGRSSKESLQRFEREVQLTSVLTHPNTVAIYDYGRTPEGTFYYVMEYLNGLDLQTLVERHGPQDSARVAHLLAQLCGALAEAHGIGLIHRDVKPANVMVCERGGVQDVIKVVDFGLIQDLDQRDEEITHSDVRAIVGTPLYLSPEALTSPETMDGRSDLYAVGAVGYFLLTGAPPFSGEGVLEVCAHHLHSIPVPPSRRTSVRVSRELEALILRCLAKSPEDRPESAAVLQAALAPLAAEWTRERAAGWWSRTV